MPILMDAAQWAKDVTSNGSYDQVEEKKVIIKPQHEEALKCPRCNSTNTKFCYYNNYSLAQPRYLCKTCKRYWTKGGSLRSVPVGGGSRKNKRSTSSSMPLPLPLPLPKPIDLSHLSLQNFTTHEPTQQDYHHLGFSQFLKLPKIENTNGNFLCSSSIGQDLNCFSTSATYSDSMLRGTNRFSLQDLKPTLGFPFQEEGERLMLPFGVLNQQHSSRDQESGQIGYWNESFGGDSSTLYN